MESLSERTSTGYQQIHDGIIHLVDSARTETVRSVNALMTDILGNWRNQLSNLNKVARPGLRTWRAANQATIKGFKSKV